MASIRKHGSKWQVQIRRKGHPAFSKSFWAREDAAKWARQQERLIDQGELEIRSSSRIVLKDLISRYQTEILPTKKSKATIFHLRQISRHLIGSLELGQITPEMIVAYRDHRLRSVSSSTVRKEMTLLGTVIKHAVTEWSVRLNEKAITSVRKPPASKGRARRLTKEEERQIILAFEKMKNIIFKNIFIFAIATGMRKSEILNLRWENIDLVNKTAFLPLTKNGDQRLVPLSPTALQILGCEIQAEKEGLVFNVSSNAMRLAWDRAINKIGIDDLNFHDLRHEAISRFFEMGLTVPEVALISGHKDPRMLFRYTHLRADELALKLHNRAVY
jgi:integrase